jgi:hypothetical protein
MEAIGDCSITNSKNTSIKKKLYSGRKVLKYPRQINIREARKMC